ncbi:MAG: HD domain-containing phosphohydrolase [Halopseudomonas sp.]
MAEEKKIKIPIDRLRIGMYIDLELSWTKHPFLFSKFKLSNQKDLGIIKSLGLTEITVIPKLSDQAALTAPPEPAAVVEPSALEEELRKDKQAHVDKAKEYRDRRKQAANKYREQAEQVRKISKDLKTQPANAIHNADEVVEGLAAEFETTGEMLTNLVNLGSGEHSFYNHNVNVTVLSLMLGSSAGIKGEALRQLAMGALLHDVGKIELPAQVTNKLGKLTPSEATLLRHHPSLGRKLTGRIRNLPSMAQAIIEFHHEMLDGSGYPHGIGGDRIPKQVRIVSIANIYDNLCNAQDPKASITPKVALAIMYKKYKDKLDGPLVEQFIRTMGVYPPGTVVQLNDDSIGLVVAGDSGAMLRPELLLYNPDIPKKDALIINLTEHPDLDITGVLKPGDYPSRIYEYLGIEERLGYFVEKR